MMETEISLPSFLQLVQRSRCTQEKNESEVSSCTDFKFNEEADESVCHSSYFYWVICVCKKLVPMSVVLYQYMAAWYADVQLTVLHKHLTGLYNMTAGLWPGYAHCETKV